MFDLTLFFWLLQWVVAYARKGEDLLLSSLLVLHQQRLWFFGLLIMAFIFTSSFDAHYYCVWDNAVELITAAEEALQVFQLFQTESLHSFSQFDSKTLCVNGGTLHACVEPSFTFQSRMY